MSEKEEKFQVQSIFDFAKQLLELKSQIKDLQEKEKTLKEEMRGIFIENNMNYFKNEEIEVKLARPYSFDIGYLKMKYPEIAKAFVKTKEITKKEDVVYVFI